MGENGSEQANHLACVVFTRRALRGAGGRKNTKTPRAFYTRYIHVARLPAAELCKTAILPFCGQL